MTVYIVGYDLHPPEGDIYDKLFMAIESIGTGYWDCLIRHGSS
jgi:hypothetical protein